MPHRCVLVQPVSPLDLEGAERRSAERRGTGLEALTRPLDAQDTLWWGATIRDISTTGVGLKLCFPFRPGTYLALDLQTPQGKGRTVLTRVVQVRDLPDASWHVGCEFVKAMSDQDLQLLVTAS